MKYKWPAAGSYPETYGYLGKSQSFLKNPLLAYALLKRLKITLDLTLPEIRQGDLVLEVGAGPGFLFPELARKDCTMVDLDYEDFHLDAVRTMILSEGIADRVTLRKGDICHLPFEDEKFDAVICLSVLEHVSLDGLDELHRVAKRGAMIIIGIPIDTMFTTVGRILFKTGGHKRGEIINSSTSIRTRVAEVLTIEAARRVPFNGCPGAFSLYDVLKCRKTG